MARGVQVSVKRDYVNGGPRNMIAALKSNGSRLAYNYAQRIESHAKKKVHVQTGYLRDSIKRQRLARYHHEVVVGAYYGVYENYGTRYRPPHPFWEPAIRAARRQYEIDKRKVFRP